MAVEYDQNVVVVVVGQLFAEGGVGLKAVEVFAAGQLVVVEGAVVSKVVVIEVDQTVVEDGVDQSDVVEVDGRVVEVGVGQSDVVEVDGKVAEDGVDQIDVEVGIVHNVAEDDDGKMTEMIEVRRIQAAIQQNQTVNHSPAFSEFQLAEKFFFREMKRLKTYFEAMLNPSIGSHSIINMLQKLVSKTLIK